MRRIPSLVTFLAPLTARHSSRSLGTPAHGPTGVFRLSTLILTLSVPFIALATHCVFPAVSAAACLPSPGWSTYPAAAPDAVVAPPGEHGTVAAGRTTFAGEVRAEAAPQDSVSKGQAAPADEKAEPKPGGGVGHDELTNWVEELQRQVGQDSTNFDLQFELANAYYDLGNLASAVAHFQKAADLDTTSVKAWVNLGVVLNEMGLSARAIDAYDKALAIDPDDNKALCNKGLAYYGMRRYYDAVNLYRRALELDPKSIEAHYNLGVAFADAEMYHEAIYEWGRVAKLAPGTDAAKAAVANIDVVMELVQME